MLTYLAGVATGLVAVLALSPMLGRQMLRDQASMGVRELLLEELWRLLNALDRIPACYRRNLESPERVSTPGALPRPQAMPMVLQDEVLATFPLEMQALLMETCSLVEVVVDEADRWAESLRLDPELVANQELYGALSARLLELVGQAMSNMLQLWIWLAVRHRARGIRPAVRLVNRILWQMSQENQRILPAYRSSAARSRIDEVDVVVCWENDWPDCPKRVAELRDLLAARAAEVMGAAETAAA